MLGGAGLRGPRPPAPTQHPQTPGALPYPGKPVVAVPITLRTPPTPPTRAQVRARCAQLLAHRSDQDPAGAAYAATTMQLNDALDALWALPREVDPTTPSTGA